MLNITLKQFKKNHLKKINQCLFFSFKTNGDKEIDNLINNFLFEKNSFVFESVEKGKIRGRYTIFGKKPEKIWEFSNNKSYQIKNGKKILLKAKPEKLIEKILEEFKDRRIKYFKSSL